MNRLSRRSQSRSPSPPRLRMNRLSRRSRSRSLTPPRRRGNRSYSRSRSRSPSPPRRRGNRSYSRSRSRSPSPPRRRMNRSYSRSRSRSLTPPPRVRMDRLSRRSGSRSPSPVRRPSRSPLYSGSASGSGSDGEIREIEKKGGSKQPAKRFKENRIEKHSFSEPWEDSDLVLTVEDEPFHVHRQILSLHSPVFKAMLNSQFKEATATEIPLPGKKANEVLDFLNALYLKETAEITLNKVRHLLKLADEYQTQGVLDLCVKCLRDVPKSEDNVVTILLLATDTEMARDDSRLDGVRSECETLVEDMELADITGMSDFKNLNRDCMESVLVRRSKRLETCLKRVYPQLFGLVEYCLFMKLDGYSSGKISRCPQHFPKSGQNANKANKDLVQRIRNCSSCRRMIKQLVSSSVKAVKNPTTLFGLGFSFSIPTSGLGAASRETALSEYFYGGSYHFDEDLITLLQDIDNVISIL